MTTIFHAVKLFFRLVGLLVILGVLGLVIFGVVSAVIANGEKPPEIKQAPWIIQTYDQSGNPMRYYYSENVKTLANGTPVANHYWTFDGEKWREHQGEISFSLKIYGKVKIGKRSG